MYIMYFLKLARSDETFRNKHEIIKKKVAIDGLFQQSSLFPVHDTMRRYWPIYRIVKEILSRYFLPVTVICSVLCLSHSLFSWVGLSVSSPLFLPPGFYDASASLKKGGSDLCIMRGLDRLIKVAARCNPFVWGREVLKTVSVRAYLWLWR